ncbi:UDP-galactopyranose mutase [Anaerospora sp.]|uniref:UDP-galactopyranose mutase n=1 Tax=Anaerospora sp. TaxID=1960278 RepID=UPI002898F49D|nr:UDP-galactopyranose mutase [Anaerospora sp.]
MYDFLIVGAGFAGCILAEQIASKLNKKVLIVERRGHIAGNAYDCYDEHGVLIHKYGPHIFHTNNEQVHEYLSQFTEWRIYEHNVLASVDGMKLPIPINMNTLNHLYGLTINGPTEVQAYYDQVKINYEHPANAEEMVISKVGIELYEKFFKGYTAKQWGIDCRELDSSVTARIPIRVNRDNRYFTDKYQGVPKHGYTKMFEKIVSHPNISVLLQTEYDSIKDVIPHKFVIYTGPIDEFFKYKYGPLPYRSLEFVYENLQQEKFQEVGQVNYPNEYKFTRITEYKHITGQKSDTTTIAYEYPIAADDNYEKYYPVPRSINQLLYNKYAEEASQCSNILFCGRLAEYRYYNMDQVVAKALELFNTVVAKPSI